MAVQTLSKGWMKVGRLFAGGLQIKNGRIGFTKVTVSVNPASITTLAVGSTVVAVTGVKTGDTVIAQPPAALEAGLVLVSAIATADNQVTLRILNATAGTIDAAAANWIFTILG
jgi:hypothetical protein